MKAGAEYRSPTFTRFVTNHRKVSLPIRHFGITGQSLSLTWRPARESVTCSVGGNNWYEIALWRGNGREQVTDFGISREDSCFTLPFELPPFRTHSSLYFPSVLWVY